VVWWCCGGGGGGGAAVATIIVVVLVVVAAAVWWLPPAVVTLVVLVFMWTWNEFQLARVMIVSESLRTAPLGLVQSPSGHRLGPVTATEAALSIVLLPSGHLHQQCK